MITNDTKKDAEYFMNKEVFVKLKTKNYCEFKSTFNTTDKKQFELDLDLIQVNTEDYIWLDNFPHIKLRYDIEEFVKHCKEYFKTYALKKLRTQKIKNILKSTI